MNKVFLSHSSNQKGFVSVIANKLGKNNIIYDEYTFEAANETTFFLQQYKEQAESPNRDLSKIWSEAATKVRDLNEELYFRLLGKAEYWADPTVWLQDRFERANMALDSIKNDSKQLLSERN